MTYRSHIDGLRAIAILFVLFFHAGLKFFPSGFIGVDIFFVISGFLITGIIHDSLNKGKFSLIEFYSRRLWRLQPALIGMLLIVTLFVYLLFLPDDLIQYGRSLRKTSLFISNQFFGKVTTGYFAQESSKLPLLHTWSLSVEWQCYFVLPLILYGAYRFGGGKFFPKIIYAVTALLIIWTLYRSGNDTSQTYYQCSSRIFEFLLGSCVALSAHHFSLNRYFIELATTLAMSVLFYLAMLPDLQIGFPNLYALILCLTTAVLIISGEQQYKSVWIRLLSTKIAVFIGLISYSLYLWHWPILGLLNYLEIQITPFSLLFIFALLMMIAYLSWRFIEKPARQYRLSHFRYAFIYLFLVPVIVSHAGYYFTKKYQGFPERFPESTVFTQLKKYQSEQREKCLVFKNGSVSKRCTFGSTNINSKKAFLFGDSFANHYWRFLDVFAQQANISVATNATGSCLALPGISQYFLSKIHQECFKQTQRYYKMIKNNHYDYVIIGESWQGYLDDRVVNGLNDIRSAQLSKMRIEKALDKALDIITTSGAIPVLLKDISLDSKKNSYYCFLKHIKQRRVYDAKQCAYHPTTMEQQWRDLFFDKMKKKYAKLIIIDPQQVLCPNNRCTADINHVPVFRDASHLTDYASYHLARKYLHLYQNPLSNQNA